MKMRSEGGARSFGSVSAIDPTVVIHWLAAKASTVRGDLAEVPGQMGIFSWILMGLVVGALAKWIMPGDDPGGILVTIGIGIAGAFVGGFLGSLIGLGSVTGFNLGSIVIAIAGALLLLYAYRKFGGAASGPSA